MKIRFDALIVLSILIIGCSPTHQLQKERPVEFVDKFNAFSTNKKAKIKAIGGRQFQAKNIRMNQDSIFWNDPERNIHGSIANRNINKIIFKNSGMGALEGLGIGLLTGLSIGAVVGLAYSDNSSGFFSSANSQAGLTGLIGGFWGGIIGLFGGALIGHNDIFVLKNPKDYTRLPNENIVEEAVDSLMVVKRGDGTFHLKKSESFVNYGFGN